MRNSRRGSGFGKTVLGRRNGYGLGNKRANCGLRVAKEAQGLEKELLIVFYDEETMMLEEEEDYGALAG